MNPLLSRLQPYPFERLKQLFAGVTPNPEFPAISLGIGEPKHATPAFIKEALSASLGSLAAYPATAGELKLRTAFTDWLERRYGLKLDPATQVLPVNGSREALFSLAQTVVDSIVSPQPVVMSPNPFYQIYEGAALLSGAEPYYVPLDEWKKLFALSDRHGFVIAADECYSEIYFRDEPPLSGLEASVKLGRPDFRNLIALTSLSKRSNVPGLRSGFVAGDAALIKKFLLYRTYHGSAMSGTVAAASIAAWGDEAHVVENRAKYRAKFAAVTPLLEPMLDVRLPDASFYLWAGVPEVWAGDDEAFARALYAQYNVTVLPGSYLARDTAHSANPGRGRIRMALVAETAECVEAAGRIVRFVNDGRR
jgi:N-succinyldiaminopimelate aminotransferase